MRYTFKDLYISSYSTSGARVVDPPPVQLALAYEPIKTDDLPDTFVFVPGDAPHDTGPNDLVAQAGEIDPLAGLLLPAVQAAKVVSNEDAMIIPLMDDFVLG